MSNQYFENNPNLKSEKRIIEFYIAGEKLSFYSDNGVFSKNGIDFGSSLLLKSILNIKASSILDVGCGIGVMGITLAKLNSDALIQMVDINERALGLTNENIILNKANNASCYLSNCYDQVKDQFDLIVTNPPIRAGKAVVHEIILKATDYLTDGGKLVFVIQKKQGAPSAIKACEEVYRSVEIINKDNGYFIIKCLK